MSHEFLIILVFCHIYQQVFNTKKTFTVREDKVDCIFKPATIPLAEAKVSPAKRKISVHGTVYLQSFSLFFT